MNESEFLSKLEEALRNDLHGDIIREQLIYYRGYIDTEKASGRDEREVIEELGDPWVIARNIIEMDATTSQAEEVKSSAVKEEQERAQKNFQVRYMQSRIGCFISVLIVIVLIFFFSSIALRLLFMVWPIILVFILGGMLFRFFTRR